MVITSFALASHIKVGVMFVNIQNKGVKNRDLQTDTQALVWVNRAWLVVCIFVVL